MGIGFYPHLAWDGIRKNKRLYLPYILTCTGMVMMFYIIAFLAGDKMLKEFRGGGFVTEMLGMGTYVIMVFAVDYAVAKSYRVILIFICRQLDAGQMLVGVDEFLHVVVERKTRHRAAQLHRDNADYIVR